mmetsp:Transcript_51550/g.103404  ORF Transcript_51550/g.103404 Transcript_51550/m.103404 type:complete len:87 (+) Transcript_51550:33-293(+)
MLGEMVLGLAIAGALGLVAVDGAWVASYVAADWDRPKGAPSYFHEKWDDGPRQQEYEVQREEAPEMEQQPTQYRAQRMEDDEAMVV